VAIIDASDATINLDLVVFTDSLEVPATEISIWFNLNTGPFSEISCLRMMNRFKSVTIRI